jgi:formylglycine-generating enzyme required for sulfatase activity
MRTLTFFLIFIFLVSQSYSQKRVALVIGNAHYGGAEELRNPEHDATLMASRLRSCGFDVILKLNRQRDSLHADINAFYQLIKSYHSCIALLYYSGHGFQHNSEDYILPIRHNLNNSADLESDIKYQCVDVNELIDGMRSRGSFINIIILDACRNDPVSRSWSRGVQIGGLAPINAEDNTMIIYSTAAGKTADDGNGKNSPFTQVFADHLLDSGVQIEEVVKRTQTGVEKINPKQVPWSNSSLTTHFAFNIHKPVNNQGDFETEKRQSLGAQLVITSMDNDLYTVYVNGDSVGEIIDPDQAVYKTVPVRGEYYITGRSKKDSAKVLEDTVEIKPEDIGSPNPKMIKLRGKPSFEQVVQGGDISHVIGNNPQLAEVLRSINGNMVPVKGGQFIMGDNKSSAKDAMPEHSVQLNSFAIAATEVTQEQWTAIMDGENPSIYAVDCRNCPVENISWDEAEIFIHKLDSLTGHHYRLPTEAEWEYAAKGGEFRSKFLFSGGNDLEKCGWFMANAGSHVMQVKQKSANARGLYDMSGNVSEWCSDRYNENFYGSVQEPVSNPTGPAGGSKRVVRGGSWNCNPMLCKVTTRDSAAQNKKSATIGFRLALPISDLAVQ